MPIHLPPLSRRRFLAGTLAAGAGALTPQWSFAEKTADSERLLFLSDLHVGSRREDELHGVKPAATLSQAVQDVLALKERPTRAIVTGDCAFLHGEAGDYRLLGELIEPLRNADMEFHFTLGNHDSRSRFLAAFPDAQKLADAKSKSLDKYVSVLETPTANWFFLDSLRKTGESSGELGKAQLQWLAKSLDARPDKPALLFAHHNPTRLTNHAMLDTAAFFDVIMPRKQVKAFLFGHTHAWRVAHQAGVHLVNIPTTSWLFGDQPRGFMAGLLRKDGLSLTLHTLDPKHPKHLEKVELAWR